VNAGGKPHFRDTLNRTEASDGWNPGSLAMLAAKRLASSRVRRCAAARRPGCSSKYTWAHKTTGVSEKPASSPSRGVDVAFGGRPWRATRASANVRPLPLTNPYSLGPSKQKTTRDESPASSGVVSGGGFNDDPWVGTMYWYG
jgi:hypothetical protein